MINPLILIWLYSLLQKTAKPESGLTQEAADDRIENFELIVSEQVQINPDNKRNECVNISILEIEYTANKNRQTLSQLKPWCNDNLVPF